MEFQLIFSSLIIYHFQQIIMHGIYIYYLARFICFRPSGRQVPVVDQSKF